MNTLSFHAQKGNTFIYVLRDPETNIIRYVGKADNPHKRLAVHLNQSTSPTDRHYRSYKSTWIRSVLNKGLKPILEVIEEVPYTLWKERERYWIAYYRECGFPLTNYTDGGDGADGLVHTDETKNKIALAGRGRKVSDSTRQKMREIGKVRGVSEVARQRAIETLTGKPRPLSEETKRKIGDANRGRVHTEEEKQRNSDAHKGKVYSAETRQKVREARLGKKASEESRRRMSEAAKKREAIKRLSKDGDRA